MAALRRLDTMALLDHLGVARWKLPFIAAHMRRLQGRTEIRPFPALPALLDDLADAGIALALVSSNAEANVRRVLGPHTAARFGRFDCGSGLFGKAGRLQAVWRASRIPADQTIAIGDEQRDIVAARRAGLVVGAVAWGYADETALAARQPDHLFRSAEELRATLLG
jgi:phosphoglycolate phosphatase